MPVSTTVTYVTIGYSGPELVVTPAGTGNANVDGKPANVSGWYNEDDPTTVLGGLLHPVKTQPTAPLPGYASSYPSTAARGGAATLTGSGSTADVFTFAATQKSVLVYNGTSATIYAYPASGSSTGISATLGDVPIGPNSGVSFNSQTDFVALYGVAGTHVNGTVAGGIVLRGGA